MHVTRSRPHGKGATQPFSPYYLQPRTSMGPSNVRMCPPHTPRKEPLSQVRWSTESITRFNPGRRASPCVRPASSFLTWFGDSASGRWLCALTWDFMRDTRLVSGGCILASHHPISFLK